MASQRPHRSVIAYNFRVVLDGGNNADGAIVNPKAVPPNDIAVTIAKTPDPEENLYSSDDNSDDDNFNVPSTPVSASATLVAESVPQSHLRGSYCQAQAGDTGRQLGRLLEIDRKYED